MRKRFSVLMITLCLLLSACTNNSESGSTNSKGANGTTPTSTTATTAEENVKASGTQAEVYDQNLAYLQGNFGPFFEKSGESEKVAKYEEPIKVSVSNWYTPTMESSMTKFGAMYGETMEANRWTDAMKRMFNIDVAYKWWSPDGDYNAKLRLDMTANDLPDIFLVREQSDLIQLAESGSIWDLSELMDKWGADIDKEAWESDDGALLEMASYDGKLYGLPSSVSHTDNFSYLWIRKDWMEKLKLERPKTMGELEVIIDSFVNADLDGNGAKDTTGLVIDKSLFYNTRGIFSAFAAYPEIWVETANGLQWGATAEENKAALKFLANQYAKGNIDKEFITKSNTDAMESILNGKAGIVLGGHWIGHTLGDLHELDPESDWISVPIPSGNGNTVKAPIVPSNHGWLVVNSKFEHPEIAFKMRALHSYTLKDKNAEWWWYEDNVAWNFSPVRANVSAFDNLFTYRNIMEAYEKNNDTSMLRAKAVPYWANLHGPLKWEWELMFGPGEDAAMSTLDEFYKEDRLFYNAFLGAQSSFMQERWSTIQDEQLIAFTKMIIGEIGIDKGFSAWVDTFNNLGGDKITLEVNEWFKAYQKK
ncbi:extracellular solute-binding protein [Paenibacillus nasutitermitis]|uniref:ABC transporter substrate-binding protein n=1 Tax=Paenibacillus nasutitermitis TaxID=1652958 RepID=A0A916ZLD4_9BACL|nr:extracellular solute-binding protein [Paenibacillus nasutitermitis]GGE02152.1 hypothetical protein GCM10010911_71500 [Paenibacillus nasutitermitis]